MEKWKQLKCLECYHLRLNLVGIGNLIENVDKLADVDTRKGHNKTLSIKIYQLKNSRTTLAILKHDHANKQK